MRKKLSTLIPSDLYEKKDGYNGKVKFTEKGKNHIIKELKINKKHPLEIAKSIGLNSSKTIIKFLKSENIDIMKEYLDRKGVVKLCECGNKYKVKPSRSNKSNYCSGKCAGKYKVPSEKIICVECNKDFYVNKFRKDSVSFCSIKCKSNSKIWKDKISIGNTGKHRSEEFKKNVSILFKKLRRTQVLPVKDTTIEVKIQKFLEVLGIEFVTHKYIKDIEYGYQCDILIPIQEGINQKIIIECDGDYWHGNLEVFEIGKFNKRILYKRCLDYERTAQLEEAGFKVIRLWENKIRKMEINELVNTI